MHGRSKAAFGLPVSCPEGQRFSVKCKACGRIYDVVTPSDWATPWSRKGGIVSLDREDPVHQHNGQWWYWDHSHSLRVGPFLSRSQASQAYAQDAGSASTKPRRR